MKDSLTLILVWSNWPDKNVLNILCIYFEEKINFLVTSWQERSADLGSLGIWALVLLVDFLLGMVWLQSTCAHSAQPLNIGETVIQTTRIHVLIHWWRKKRKSQKKGPSDQKSINFVKKKYVHVLIPVRGLTSRDCTASALTCWSVALLVEMPSSSKAGRQDGPLSRPALPLRRINLFGPWTPDSLPLTVRAPMTLCRSAVLGMTTTCVSDMEGWSRMRTPSGKPWLVTDPDGSLELGAPDWLCNSALVGGSFCWKGNFLRLRIRGLRGLRLMVNKTLKKVLAVQWCSAQK